ncbi:MAG: potassium channel protein [Candidatus Aenigmarchaeota archaeon]|nr:potassium channel protein [Candidatus Aenigmarchaeota archaeon]
MAENVKDLIEEVKNLSELMLDLAYSSVLFDSKDIAKEVIISYDRLKELEERLYMHLFAASRGKFSHRFISIINLIANSERVATAAKNMAELVLDGKEMHPVIKSALKESEETVVRTQISSASIFSNQAIGDLKVRTQTGARIIAIRRDEAGRSKWVFNPRKDTVMRENDVLIAVGPKPACDKLRKVAEGVLKKL